MGSSPADPSVAGNWSSGPIASGDDAYIQAIPGLTLAPIDAHNSSAVALNSLTYNTNSQVIVGTNATPGGAWQIGTSTFTVPIPTINNLGAGRVKLDFGSSAVVANIAATGTATSLDAGLEPMRIIGSAMTSVNVTGGLVGIATSAPSETATVTTVNVASVVSVAQVNMGPGVTWTHASAASGNGGGAFLAALTGGTDLTTSAGATANMAGTTAITTVNAGGVTQLNQRSGGVDCTTLNIYPGGQADFSGNPAASTVTTLNLFAGGTLSTDPANPDHVTVTTFHKKNGGNLTLG